MLRYLLSLFLLDVAIVLLTLLVVLPRSSTNSPSFVLQRLLLPDGNLLLASLVLVLSFSAFPLLNPDLSFSLQQSVRSFNDIMKYRLVVVLMYIGYLCLVKTLLASDAF